MLMLSVKTKFGITFNQEMIVIFMRKEILTKLASCKNIKHYSDFNSEFFETVKKCNEYELRFLINEMFLNCSNDKDIKNALCRIEDYVKTNME